MSLYITRYRSTFPFQTWKPFPPEAIVCVANKYFEKRIGLARKFWWGYERECGEVGEGVIIFARRLDKPKTG